MKAATKAPQPPAAPEKAHVGVCGATRLCNRCGSQSDCPCEGYAFARRMDLWNVCECGHTHQVHALAEVNATQPRGETS